MTEKEQKNLYGDVNFKLFCDFTVVTNRCLAETMVTMVIFVRVYLQHILCSKKNIIIHCKIKSILCSHIKIT